MAFAVLYHTGKTWPEGTQIREFSDAEEAVDWAHDLRQEHPEWEPTVDRLIPPEEAA